MSAARYESAAQTMDELNRQRAALRRGAELAAATAVAGVQSLMRPDDVRPGPGRLAYRLGYAGLTAAGSWLTRNLGKEEDAAPNVRLDAGLAAGAGILGYVLFSPRVKANWWTDRWLERAGVRSPRLVGALGTTALMAAAYIAAERAARRGDLEFSMDPGQGVWQAFAPLGGRIFQPGEDEDDVEEIELTDRQRAVLDALVPGNSANARALRAQLGAARFSALGGHEFLLAEVDEDAVAERLVPHEHTHPVRGRFRDAGGAVLEISIGIMDGRLEHIAILPVLDEDGEGEEADVSGLSAADWPDPEDLEIVKDER
ncbi:hypothetical protein [Sediminivirga luteola]|uniref:hypothetical protein n=1 Tax=Sediminivirga luteola TaxID=1774748 RepID=UPI001F55EBA6|nr:hypothetical protein [Sediminivirga luteola]MCI2266145.1 hypothetical protein [Sediminivirga luteola]